MISNSQIIITEDWEELKEQLEEEIESSNLRFFIQDEFKVEDAKEVIKEAYIASKEQKVLFLAANRYNIYAQNALLKILEEPPANMIFLLVAKNKSTFLPTILSRLPVKKIQSAIDESYDLSDFDLQKLYELVQKSKEFSKSQAKAILKSMLEFTIKRDFQLSQRELDYFHKATQLIELSSNKANIFITAGLILLTHKKKRR